MYYIPDFQCSDTSPLQSELDALYDYASDIETRVLHRCRLNLFSDMLDRLDRDGLLVRKASALDIGCNAGVYSQIISDHGFESVEGVDIEPWMIERAQRRFGSDQPGRRLGFRVANAEELPENPRYDFMLCTEVIEHTTHPEKVIANIRTRLAPGGIAVVSLPNACSLPFIKAALKYRLTRRARDPVFEDHLRFPFWRSMHLMDGSDLRCVHVTGTNLWWDAPALKLLYGTALFEPLNRFQFALARHAPLCFLSQFFFMVFRREMHAAAL